MCVSHPFVRQELLRLVEEPPFRLLSCKLDSRALTRREWLRIPRASVFIVDAPFSREQAEYLVSEILTRFPRARILVIGEKLDEALAFSLLGSGVAGLLPYSEIHTRLLEALRTLSAGGFWVPRKVLAQFVEHRLRDRPRPAVRPPGSALSPRETEILDLLLGNLSNKEIASRLHISSRTVKFHVSHLLAKFGVRGRTDLLLQSAAGGS